MDYWESPQFPEEVARSGYKNRKEREMYLGNDSDEIMDKQM